MLVQLAASGPTGIVAVIAIAIIKILFERLIAEKEARLTDRDTFRKEILEERERRIGDAQLFTKTHNDLVREAYQYAPAFEELADLIRDQAKEQQKRREQDLQRQIDTLQDAPRPPRPGSKPQLSPPPRKRPHEPNEEE